ncbi:MAG TPA: dockerin type I domain-containing protein [Phycisphaerae bacterium]|nr:dockerin type I domain-containing protein [Phycisphaerae bacterium]HOJ72492.1 dockerin type I domain-containing protein [Phycisphaerae bacterium]HOM49846.1 dockerin type I domain-containing protein [Phycisphaerae bacterium]HON66176.1 dockerin type I domain-containing protein [Phycisphaerae bacterium]HOQ84294.1 dockerin type I domain-containing protein [Phycisphaerae bacterium]
MTGCSPSFLLSFLAIASVVTAAPPSSSKLGIHLIHNHTAGVTQICNAHPRVIKILDLNNGMLSAMRAYKNATPNGLVVLRIYTTRRYTLADNPATSGAHFFTTVLQPAISSLSASDRALIDYVEGPNEGENTPTWGTVQDALWFNDFWMALAPLIANAGFKPCAFSTAVGNPPGSQGEIQQKLAAVVPALRLCKQLGGAWSYHAYTPNWSTDVSFQWWYSLRYRQFYNYFANSFPDLVDMPLILTEAGFDSGGSPTGSGWQANGTAAQYQAWLTWWDDQIRRDPYVLGSTIFQIGSPGTWPSFDLEPIAGWMASHLASLALPSLVCSPTTLTPSTTQGSNPPPDSFTVTNVGHKTMSYTISDDVEWLSVHPTSGTSSGETDTIEVTYTAAGLAVGTHIGRITVTAAGAEHSPEVVTVTLTVNEKPIPGDLNGDGFVDGRDVAIFLPCMTAPQEPPQDPACSAADFDGDTDVDQSDFGILQKCIRGDAVPGDRTCADS